MLIFLLLFLYHGALSLSKTYAMALLAQVSWLALIVYTVADHVAFQLLKLACNDFIYWMPNAGFIVSSISRFVAKVVTDFTGTLSISGRIELEIRLVNARLSGRIGAFSASARARRRLLLAQHHHEPALGLRRCLYLLDVLQPSHCRR